MATATSPAKTNPDVAVAAPMPTAQQASLIASMAAKYGLDPTAFFKAIKATIFDHKGTQEEVCAFLIVADHYDLNPFTKEIYAFQKQGGGIMPIVPVDGWSKIINRNPAFDGMAFIDEISPSGDLASITCRMFRNDRKHPIECTEYMSECVRGSMPWKQWPRRMLRHKAMIQAARYAFGLAGIMDPDEAERAESAGWGQQNQSKVGTSNINKLLEAMPAHKPSETHQEHQEGVDDIPPDDGNQEATDALEGFDDALQAAVTKADIKAVFNRYMKPGLTAEQVNYLDSMVSEKMDTAPDLVERKTKQRTLGE